MPRPAPLLNGLPAQVLSTYKRLVQYIHEHGLEDGDRLPTQPELCRLLGRNNYTLSATMQALVSQGAIARKTSVGTVIRDRSAIGPVPWSVGVATIEAPLDGELSVFANLATRVQSRLNRDGCRCLSYSRPDGAPDTPAQFGLLENDLDAGLLDGLVILTMFYPSRWANLRDRRIPIVHLPFWEEAPGGVVFDHGRMVAEAAGEMAAAGCQSFAILSRSPRCLDSLAVGLADAGLATDRAEALDSAPGVAGGEAVARELLRRAPRKRPDGLIVLDNYVAVGLTRVLAESAYRPEIAVYVQRQLPLHYPLPIRAFAVDLEAMANHAVDLMQRRLLRPGDPDVLEYALHSRLYPDASIGTLATAQTGADR